MREQKRIGVVIEDREFKERVRPLRYLSLKTYKKTR